ncbi:MAG TPA: hypothetical protein VKX40_14525 [Aequorivita sp.]|jgi:hypothetical protein|nr:hypothetical protein [Aequorivita sp.]
MWSNGSETIKDFICERIYKIHKEILPSDREYQELGIKPAEIQRQLMATLSPEKQKMLLDCDEAQTLRMNRQDEIFYIRGFVDGILLGHCVDWIRREPEKFLFELGFKRENEVYINQR